MAMILQDYSRANLSRYILPHILAIRHQMARRLYQEYSVPDPEPGAVLLHVRLARIFARHQVENMRLAEEAKRTAETVRQRAL